MLHPKKTQKFKFYSEAWTYIKIMAVIGLAGMIYHIYDSIKNDYTPSDAILGSLDLVGISFSFVIYIYIFCERLL